MVDGSQVAAVVGRRRTTILVAEDEVLVRMSIAEDLRDAGYQVIEASTADEALSILEGGAEVDLVFSDIQMPGALDGFDLLRAIRARHPRTAVILTSGRLITRPRDLSDDVTLIPKPYGPRLVIAEIVRAVGKQD